MTAHLTLSRGNQSNLCIYTGYYSPYKQGQENFKFLIDSASETDDASLLILGDLNCRVGTIQNVICDELEEGMRNSKDLTVNARGEQLIQEVHENGCRL